MGPPAKSSGRGGQASVLQCLVAGLLLGVIAALVATRPSGPPTQPICPPCKPCAELPAGLEGGLSGEDALPKLVKELQDASALIGHLRREVAHQSARIAELAERGAQGGGTYSDRYEAWIPSAQRDAAAKDPALAQLLRKIALNGEVLAAVSNMALAGDGGMLQTFVESVRAAGIQNAMVIAIDPQTKRQVEKWGMPAHHMTIQLQGAQKQLGMSNHGVSGMKFRILRHFMELGYSVLLSDVDIVFLQNPFHHLRRDVDVESMSDGWDNATAYGFNDVYDDPAMGWARFAHSMRQVVFNSGLFYLRPTQATVDFLDMIIDRQATMSLGPHQHFTLPGQYVWQGEVSLQSCINIQGMVSEHCDWRSVQHGYLRGVLGECGFGAYHRSV